MNVGLIIGVFHAFFNTAMNFLNQKEAQMNEGLIGVVSR